MCHRTTPKNRKLMKHVVIALSFITSLLLSSCDTAGSFMNASGSANEVLVVMDDTLWEGEAGSALFDVLNSNRKPTSTSFRLLRRTSPAPFAWRAT